jgi:hypothetical protein
MIKLPDILPVPEHKPDKLKNAKWLSGEGAGSWFFIKKENLFRVFRYSDTGNFECGGIFRADKPFDPDSDYILTYPSHCLKITVVQKGEIISLEIKEKLSEYSAK